MIGKVKNGQLKMAGGQMIAHFAAKASVNNTVMFLAKKITIGLLTKRHQNMIQIQINLKYNFREILLAAQF